MEVVISVAVAAKFLALGLGFIVLSLFLAFMILFPISDQPTSKTQWTVYGIAELVLFAYMFGVFSIKFVA